MHYDYIYTCNTCGKERPSVDANGDCSSCRQIHNDVPSPPNAECGYCHNLVHLLNDAIQYWCYDCNTAYPASEADPL